MGAVVSDILDRIGAAISKALDEISGAADKARNLAENDPGISDDLVVDVIEIVEAIDRNVTGINNALDRLQDDVTPADVDRLHEAICEGRKQDAIDILNEMHPDANLRSAAAQANLFPNRVIS